MRISLKSSIKYEKIDHTNSNIFSEMYVTEYKWDEDSNAVKKVAVKRELNPIIARLVEEGTISNEDVANTGGLTQFESMEFFLNLKFEVLRTIEDLWSGHFRVSKDGVETRFDISSPEDFLKAIAAIEKMIPKTKQDLGIENTKGQTLTFSKP